MVIEASICACLPYIIPLSILLTLPGFAVVGCRKKKKKPEPYSDANKTVSITLNDPSSAMSPTPAAPTSNDAPDSQPKQPKEVAKKTHAPCPTSDPKEAKVEAEPEAEAKKEAPKQSPQTEPKADDNAKTKEPPIRTPTTAEKPDVPSKPAENNAADNKPVNMPNVQKQIEKLKKKKAESKPITLCDTAVVGGEQRGVEQHKSVKVRKAKNKNKTLDATQGNTKEESKKPQQTNKNKKAKDNTMSSEGAIETKEDTLYGIQSLAHHPEPPSTESE
ncbi:hypothetical protein AAVH_30407 [Aphelenchoides avenae]|nr:hypothetical protein AAVH_30407 [Aphelenchus avenae]